MSDFRSRLERELVQAAGRPRRARYAATTPLASWVTATGTLMIVVLTVLLARGGAPADDVAVTTPPAQAPTAQQALAPLLERGTRLSATEVASLDLGKQMLEITGPPERVWRVPPPAGAEGQTWLVILASNGSGSACLLITTNGRDERGGGGCGNQQQVITTGIAATRNTGRGSDPWGPGMRAHFSGVVPSAVTSIVVRDADRRVAGRIAVTGQTYRLDVAAEKVGSVEFRDPQGRELGVFPVLDRQTPLSPTPTATPPGFTDGYRRVDAQVTVRPSSAKVKQMTIDVGRRDGVHGGDPVVDRAGLVGTVATSSAGSSLVTLITDESFGASVYAGSGEHPGSIASAIEPSDSLIFEPVDTSAAVLPDDPVYTAGTTAGAEPRYPRAVLVGRVKRVDIGDGERGRRFYVTPAADLLRLDAVQVLTDPHP